MGKHIISSNGINLTEDEHIETVDKSMTAPKWHNWVYKLPRRPRYWVQKFLITLRIVRRYGIFEVVKYDEQGNIIQRVRGYNLVTDQGVKKVGDVLIGSSTHYLDQLQTGSSTQAPAIGDTAVIAPTTPAARITATAKTRSAVSPYEIKIEGFIGSADYTRPFTINEMAVHFTPAGTGDSLARSVLQAPITFTGSQSGNVSYGVVFR